MAPLVSDSSVSPSLPAFPFPLAAQQAERDRQGKIIFNMQAEDPVNPTLKRMANAICPSDRRPSGKNKPSGGNINKGGQVRLLCLPAVSFRLHQYLQQRDCLRIFVEA